MAALGLALAWTGYTLVYFGFCSTRGAGVGLFDLVIPGRTFIIPGGDPFPVPANTGESGFAEPDPATGKGGGAVGGGGSTGGGGGGSW